METNVEYEVAKGKKPSLFGIFTSPTEQFKRMKGISPIGGPLVIMLLLAAITGMLEGYISLNNPIIKNASSTTGFQIPDGITIGSAAIGGIFTAAIIFFLGAAIYKIFMVFMGNDTPYKKLVVIVIYTSIIYYLGTFINCLIAMAFGGYEAIYTSLAPLAGNNLTLKAILKNFDIFNIWYYIVSGMGLYYAAGLSKNKAITVIVIFFLLGLGLSAVVTLIHPAAGTGL